MTETKKGGWSKDKLIYEKIEGSKRYKRIGPYFEGFPCDGIWYVCKGRHSVLMYLKDITPFPDIRLDYLSLQGKVFDYIMQNALPTSAGRSAAPEGAYSFSIHCIIENTLKFLAIEAEKHLADTAKVNELINKGSRYVP